MFNLKLISFEIGKDKTTDSAAELMRLVNSYKSGEPISLEDWQKAGVPVSSRLIGKQITEAEFIRSLGKIPGGEKKVTKEITIPAEGIIIPEVIKVPRKSFSVMKSPVSVGQYKEFIKKTKYKGSINSKARLELLKRGKTGEMMDYISLTDARVFAKWLSEITGRKYDIPKYQELVDSLELGGRELKIGQGHEYTSTIDYHSVYTYYRALPVNVDGRSKHFLKEKCNEDVFLRLVERKRKD